MVNNIQYSIEKYIGKYVNVFGNVNMFVYTLFIYVLYKRYVYLYMFTYIYKYICIYNVQKCKLKYGEKITNAKSIFKK